VPQSDPQSDGPPELPPQSPSRFQAAWSVLRGESLVPSQIQAEWFEYQQIFGDLLQRLSAQLARQAKSERKRIRRLVESSDPAEAQVPSQRELPLGSSRKSELRRRFASQFPTGARARPPSPFNGHQPSPQEESP